MNFTEKLFVLASKKLKQKGGGDNYEDILKYMLENEDELLKTYLEIQDVKKEIILSHVQEKLKDIERLLEGLK